MCLQKRIDQSQLMIFLLARGICERKKKAKLTYV
jgi:hypothetical protein